MPPINGVVNIEEGLKEIGENNDFSPAFIPKEVKDAGLNYIKSDKVLSIQYFYFEM